MHESKKKKDKYNKHVVAFVGFVDQSPLLKDWSISSNLHKKINSYSTEISNRIIIKWNMNILIESKSKSFNFSIFFRNILFFSLIGSFNMISNSSVVEIEGIQYECISLKIFESDSFVDLIVSDNSTRLYGVNLNLNLNEFATLVSQRKIKL